MKRLAGVVITKGIFRLIDTTSAYCDAKDASENHFAALSDGLSQPGGKGYDTVMSVDDRLSCSIHQLSALLATTPIASSKSRKILSVLCWHGISIGPWHSCESECLSLHEEMVCLVDSMTDICETMALVFRCRFAHFARLARYSSSERS